MIAMAVGAVTAALHPRSTECCNAAVLVVLANWEALSLLL